MKGRTRLHIIEKVSNEGGSEEDSESLKKQIKDYLSYEIKYEIQHIDNAESFVDSYKLKIVSYDIYDNNSNDITEKDEIVHELQEHLNKVHESMTAAQNKLAETFMKKKNGAEKLKDKINEKLEASFAQEDSRLQEALSLVKENVDNRNYEELEELMVKVKVTFITKQSYFLNDSYGERHINVNKETSLEFIDFEKRKPTNVTASFTSRNDVSLSFTFFVNLEMRFLKSLDFIFRMIVDIFEKGDGRTKSKTYKMDYVIEDTGPIFIKGMLASSTTYCMRVRVGHCELNTEWSDDIEFITPDFKFCYWKRCPNHVDNERKYSVDENNPRIAVKSNYSDYSNIIGNTSLPLNRVVSWDIKILKSKDNDGGGIYVGIAPFDINQDGGDNYDSCGWYFNCWYSTLRSGLPHKYGGKAYGSRKWDDGYVHTGDVIGLL